jgi:hypothetical protein
LLNEFDKEVGHLRRYTKEELIFLVKKNGYKIVSVKSHEGILRNFLFTNPTAGRFLRLIRWPFSEIISAIDYLTIPLFGASSIHLIAKKK